MMFSWIQRLVLISLLGIFTIANSDTTTDRLSKALRCIHLTDSNSLMHTRYILLYTRRDRIGYVGMCVDEINSQNIVPLTCNWNPKTTVDFITSNNLKINRSTLLLEDDASGANYQCQVESNPITTKSRIEKLKKKQLRKNKI
ncbi:MAG: hypothetical protein VX513_05445 [Pseudomonadota bacterium]|nr:hypothetical protein [Pseudomonadota bacterium]